VARVGMPRKWVFVCINERPAEHPRPSCIRNGSAGLFEAIREETGRLGLVDVKVVASGCLEPCMVGPAIYVAPDDVWYGGVTVDDVPPSASSTSPTTNRSSSCASVARVRAVAARGRTDLPPGMIPPV
jgi:hypothetical protein